METFHANASFYQSLQPPSWARFARKPETWGFMAPKPNTDLGPEREKTIKFQPLKDKTQLEEKKLCLHSYVLRVLGFTFPSLFSFGHFSGSSKVLSY